VYNTDDYKLIELLRFPMMCAVVCIHCNLCVSCPWLEELTVFSSFTYGYIHILCSIANPVFFFIAGFLFFKEGHFSLSLYCHKLRRRIRTLLVPYIVWIVIYLVIIAALQFLKPDFNLLLHKPIGQLSLTDFCYLFWDLQQVTHLTTDQSAPLVTQFWFLQCLMVCVLLSPVIWIGIKYLSWSFLVLLSIISMFDLLPESPGFVGLAFFYFSLGAWFSVYRTSVTLFVIQYRPYIYPLLAIFIILSFYIIQMLFLLNICLLFIVFDIGSRIVACNIQVTPLLTSASFFIFAVHRFFTAIMTNIPKLGLIHLTTELSAFGYYIIAVVISIALCLFSYMFMYRCSPFFTSLLSGGRNSKK